MRIYHNATGNEQPVQIAPDRERDHVVQLSYGVVDPSGRAGKGLVTRRPTRRDMRWPTKGFAEQAVPARLACLAPQPAGDHTCPWGDAPCGWVIHSCHLNVGAPTLRAGTWGGDRLGAALIVHGKLSRCEEV